MPGARLELIDALGRHRIVGINRDPFTIGRSHSNSLPLTSAEISREHANIVIPITDFLPELAPGREAAQGPVE